MPYPYRVPRCALCGRESVMSFRGETYCAFDIPYRQMSDEYTMILHDMVGKDARDQMIDKRFPNDFTNWEEYYGWVKDMVEKLGIGTGLLSFNP
jgi:hypothetical protein